jgi:hypothetical protein
MTVVRHTSDKDDFHPSPALLLQHKTGWVQLSGRAHAQPRVPSPASENKNKIKNQEWHLWPITVNPHPWFTHESHTLGPHYPTWYICLPRNCNMAGANWHQLKVENTKCKPGAVAFSYSLVPGVPEERRFPWTQEFKASLGNIVTSVSKQRKNYISKI